MKKWLYFVVPVIMLVIFTFFYFTHAEEVAQKEIVRQERIEAERAAEAERKAKIEEEARIDAEKRAAERAEKAEQKEAERIAKWEAETAEIKSATAEHKAEADKHAAKAAALEIELHRLRQATANANQAVLANAKRVEEARIAKRNAELEIQRKTEMMIRTAERSAVAKMPPPVPINLVITQVVASFYDKLLSV